MRPILCLSACLALPFLAQSAAGQMVDPDPINGADQARYIRAALPLDEPRHLCIDLPGHGEASDPTQPFTVHTCKDGMWNYDQRFEWINDGMGLQMPQYELCLAAETASAGANLVLVECGAELAHWVSSAARLTLAADPSLCITIADEVSELTPGGRRFPQRYRARSVAMDTCSADAIERQLWSVTQPLDLTEPLLPPAGSLPVEG